MAAQAEDEQRRAIADVVLDNSGTEAELAAQVDRFWTERVEPTRRGG
jgi:dephospho-CoA kinase